MPICMFKGLKISLFSKLGEGEDYRRRFCAIMCQKEVSLNAVTNCSSANKCDI